MTDSVSTGALAGFGRSRRRLDIFSGVLGRISRDWRGEGLVIRLPGGRTLAVGPETPGAVVRIQSFNLIRRVLDSGDIGFAEGYIAGEWDTPDLARLLTVLADNFDALSRLGVGGPVAHVANWLFHLGRANTLDGSKRNIAAHYDLGNAFYAAWLDPGMTYSSALFTDERQALEAAQQAKYAALAHAIGLERGHSVLEVGCGWGGFAEYAAKEVGAQVTALTISPAQHAFASERIQREGLGDKVEVRLCDYREAQGRYDRLVSIEMFEAVGERYWPTFFAAIRDRLKPGGRAGLQIITIREDLFDDYRGRVDFIQKYVFPGGMLPSEARLRQESERAGLAWSETGRFGLDYARTLALWNERFQAAGPVLRRQGFDDSFIRLWTFYLAYCQAGFATGRTNVVQATAARAS